MNRPIKNKNSAIHPQNGSVIMWVLIAVGLMAALSYAFMGSSRNSTSMISNTQAEAYASEIIAYGNEVKSAVKRLQLRGCSDTEISFENNVVSGYTNSNSPPDSSCHVFDIAGGGLQLINGPNPFANTGVECWNGKYSFINGTEWHGNGSTCAAQNCVDLIMLFYTFDQNICDIINKNLGYSSTPTDTLFGGGQFQGSYGYSQTLADEVSGSEASKEKSACFFRTSDSTYIYAQLLISR